ncbi:MAG: hypothetical protein ACI863_001328 [Flavobacteriales bacterium]|jgi:hypothetical protein|tara:strand:+ start:4999 stop:5211 length:213 start_codon:yes stop_codon:yes gene_type:complete
MKKLSALLFFLLMSNPSNAQCAMCKAVAENGNVDIAEGLNAGILFLMAFPYILVAGALYVIYRFKMRNKN